MSYQGLYGAVPLSHFFLRERLKPGGRAVDATCGNGQDTLLLAELVGNSGKVWGFDLQAEAIVRTKELLAVNGCADRVDLILKGHEHMAEFIDEPVCAVIFNLGYLPKGDQTLKTSAASTVSALEAAISLLCPSGMLLVAVYTGHDGGEEWQAVRRWCEGLNPHEFNVWQSRQLNRSDKAPFLVIVEKIPAD